MSGEPAIQTKMVNGKKVKVYSLVMITDADKQKILLGLKKRGLCGFDASNITMLPKFSYLINFSC